MGLIYTKLKLINEWDLALYHKNYIEEKEIRHLNQSFLVDSGAYMLTINKHMVNQLSLEKITEQEAELADSSVQLLDIVV